jgi:hypothetical protein
MQREFVSMRLRLIRLLRDAMEDYRESARELEPLYNEALNNSRYLRGATLALDRLTKQGRPSLGLRERLAIPAARSGGAVGLLSDDHAEAYLCQLSRYEPREPEPVGASAIKSLPTVVAYIDVRTSLELELPVDDTLSWLQQSYPDLTLHQTLGLYGRIFGDAAFRHLSGDARAYRFDAITAHARTLRLEVAHG